MTTDGFIEPNVFDVVVVGTGLPEAILAAAAAASGHSVLHLDAHDFYGAHWASLNLKDFSCWAASGGAFLDTSSATATNVNHSPSSGVESAEIATPPVEEATSVETKAAPILDSEEERGFDVIEVESGRSFFSEAKVFDYGEASLESSRSYSIDLSGPRLAFCGSNLVNLLLRSGASHYVEFKGIDASYIWTGTCLSAVPSSRADVFKDKSLSLSDKHHLMRFFKLVTAYTTSEDQTLTDGDLDSPFVHFLRRQDLPTSIQLIILYAIALVDHEQQHDVEDTGALLKTRDGLHKLALYLSSVARFPNASGAFMYPLYGQGELPQAFCRAAAVNGAVYVLRRPVTALLIDKDTKEYKGVKTLQGQVLYSKRLIMGPNVVPKVGHVGDMASLARLGNQPKGSACQVSASSSTVPVRSGLHVARCVCITDCSISEGHSTLLVIFPPRSVQESWSTVIRALQLSNTTSVSPVGKFVVQLSTVCSDTIDGQEALGAAVQALFSSSGPRHTEQTENDCRADVPSKPRLLWSVSYVQTLNSTSANLTVPGVAVCDLPDETLDGEGLLAQTEKLFRDLFPDKEYFPQVAAPEENEPDDV